jgi:hypothetical protein
MWSFANREIRIFPNMFAENDQSTNGHSTQAPNFRGWGSWAWGAYVLWIIHPWGDIRQGEGGLPCKDSILEIGRRLVSIEVKIVHSWKGVIGVHGGLPMDEG